MATLGMLDDPLRYDLPVEPAIVVIFGANGDLTKAVTVKVDKVSQGARERIIAAGGQVEE